MDQTRCIWTKLLIAGARVPLDPADLDATHLIIAEADYGVDIYRIIAEVMTPRSVGYPQTV